MILEKLTTLADNNEIDIKTIQGLDTAPEMSAADLKKKFDTNVRNLAEAIDKYIVEPINSARFVAQEELEDFGAGDMMKAVYDPNNNGMVARSFGDKNGDDIVETYATKEEAAQSVAGIMNNSTAKAALLNAFFPVGSIKFTVNDQNPGSTLGGTWVKWGAGKVPIGVDESDTDFNAAEKTGGAKAVNLQHNHVLSGNTGATTLAVSQIPAHTHTFTGASATTSSAGAHQHASAGSHSHAAAGAHTHSVSPSHTIHDYKVGSGSGSTYEYWTITGNANSPASISWSAASAGSHSHAAAGAHQHASAGAHTHTLTAKGSNANTGGGGSHNHSLSGNTGNAGSTAQSVLQPYITCYMWKRTA